MMKASGNGYEAIIEILNEDSGDLNNSDRQELHMLNVEH